MINTLEWNVYREDINRRDFIKYNVFSHYHFVQDISTIIKAFEKREKQELLNLEIFCNGLSKAALTRKANAEEKARLEFLEEEIRGYCRYHFWGRCECEVLLCSWPNAISMEELDRINSEVKEHKEKYPNLKHYRVTVNCDVCDKISIYDQLELNWNQFFLYIRENAKEIKKLANELKKKYNN